MAADWEVRDKSNFVILDATGEFGAGQRLVVVSGRVERGGRGGWGSEVGPVGE